MLVYIVLLYVWILREHFTYYLDSTKNKILNKNQFFKKIKQVLEIFKYF